ncbi:mitotic arrest deficient 1, NITRIC OXIDE-INDUCED EARLY COTYLEDON SENESCENCE 1 [Hibiscus trionum]|uniref:Mitotic arrest deficient 1, NITRIC OXIDE-INDUCED EARLY COTYLEDON SENESCENCE 1 n=1 Tax=Hibiscus trionum TaxID=183268 RepID=A0A9W7HZ81_HIBTR|nr:mitotic arrest deficient 1, NITRIC OXIDE-INDUCED EARLY COTYLEDON SENESCENCE 1 [Hibiscus trionum]
MILRTPPPKKQRSEPVHHESPSPLVAPEGPLIIYEDSPLAAPPPESPHQPSDHLLCTYQCRQMVKADFLDALSNAEKQNSDYQAKLEALSESLSKAEAEKKKFRDQFLYAEQELAAAKGREQMLRDQLLKEVNDSQERFKMHLETNNELKGKLQNEMNLRKKAESSAASAEEKAADLEGKLTQFSQSIEREKKRLHNELAQLKGESKLSVSRISADLERMEFRANNAEKQSELLKEQLEDLKKQLNECLNQKSEVEKKFSSFTFQEVTSSESSILIKHLQEELRNYESEVREARKLKSSHEDIELLKAKLLEEKGRRERVESELSKLQEQQISLNNLENELSLWKLIMNNIPDVSCPEDIPVKFATLQKEVIDSTIKIGEVNARLKQIEVGLDAAEFAKQNAEADAVLVKEKTEALKSEIKRIELMLSMVTEERDKLRNVINESKKHKNEEAGDEVASGTVVQELESSLAKKESCIKELERNLHEQKEINDRQHNEITLLHDRLNNEARRIKSLERESDRLRSEISLLESKLGHGDYSAANTKVLRMVNTLAVDSEAKQTIEALQTELQKTKEKLQALEELKSQSGDTGKLVDSYISEKIMKLKEQIATLEKREERYKTVFADRISVFRRACCELFGYKIVMDEHQRPNGIPVTRFTLQSIYAQNDDEKLEFEYESGNTNILANNYTAQPEISHQVDIFVRKMNSIPAFTANLTVESFNRRTLS